MLGKIGGSFPNAAPMQGRIELNNVEHTFYMLHTATHLAVLLAQGRVCPWLRYFLSLVWGACCVGASLILVLGCWSDTILLLKIYKKVEKSRCEEVY